MNRFCLILCYLPLFHVTLFTQEISNVASLPNTLEEASGMVYIDNQGLYILDDTKKPFIYKVCEHTGNILQVIQIHNISFTDKESLTADETFLYVGDIGDNKGKRKSLKIVKIPVDQLTSKSDTITLRGEVINLQIAGKKKPKKKKENIYDFEAMFVYNDSIYLLSKQRSDLKTTLYVLPNKGGNQLAQRKCDLTVDGLITGAALQSNGKQLAITGYQKRKKAPFIFILPHYDLCNVEAKYLTKIPIFEPRKSFQVEAITFLSDSTIYFSNEWTSDYGQGLYKLKLSSDVDE